MADKTLLGNLTNGESDCNIKKKRKKYALLAQMLLTQLVYSAIIQNCVAMPTRLPGGATMLEELKTAKKVVGVKQLRRALNDHLARTVFLACDADPALTEPIEAICQSEGVEVMKVRSMRELGQACGISVGASAAAILC